MNDKSLENMSDEQLDKVSELVYQRIKNTLQEWLSDFKRHLIRQTVKTILEFTKGKESHLFEKDLKRFLKEMEDTIKTTVEIMLDEDIEKEWKRAKNMRRKRGQRKNSKFTSNNKENIKKS